MWKSNTVYDASAYLFKLTLAEYSWRAIGNNYYCRVGREIRRCFS